MMTDQNIWLNVSVSVSFFKAGKFQHVAVKKKCRAEDRFCLLSFLGMFICSFKNAFPKLHSDFSNENLGVMVLQVLFVIPATGIPFLVVLVINMERRSNTNLYVWSDLSVA